MKHSFLLKIIITVLLLSLIPTMIMAAGTSLVTDFAGTGDLGFKDGVTTEAKFNQPYGIAMDIDGGILIVDTYNQRIRKAKDGKVTTLAGLSDSKDKGGFPIGGLADGENAKARFKLPRAAVVDSKGNIFITDTGNHLIRKITNGKVVTFSGSVKGAGYADGTGSEVKFNTPSGMTIDKDDNLYIADSLNHVIRKITPKGVVTTYAGKNTARGDYKDGSSLEALFNEPSDVKIDSRGVLYVLDSGNQLVRKIEDNKVSTIAGVRAGINADTGYAAGDYADGQANKAHFNFPKGFAIAEDGTIFISDTFNHRIRAIKTDGSVITIAGNGQPGKRDDPLMETMFNGPRGILYTNGTLYIADTWNNAIRGMKIDLKALPDITDRSLITKGIKFLPKSSVPQIWFNKEQVKFTDAKPYHQNGKTYLPIRAVFEKWGAKVKWISPGQVEVTKGSFYKVLSLKKDPLIMIKGRTYIDTKTFTEISGFTVEIVPEFNGVVIIS